METIGNTANQVASVKTKQVQIRSGTLPRMGNERNKVIWVAEKLRRKMGGTKGISVRPNLHTSCMT